MKFNPINEDGTVEPLEQEIPDCVQNCMEIDADDGEVMHICMQSEQIKELMEANKIITVNQNKMMEENSRFQIQIEEVFSGINKRLLRGNRQFQEIHDFIIEKKVENGNMKEDIQESKTDKKAVEERIRDLENSRVTWEYLKGNVENKIPSSTLIWINTLVLAMFILAIIFENARNSALMQLVGL